MADIQLNSVTLATESGGTVTLNSGVQDNITRLGTVTSGTLGSETIFPAGVARSMGFLTREITSSSNSGTLGGTGLRIVPFTNIRDGYTGSKWINPVLTLSSNYWTMQTGVYWWLFHRTHHQTNHHWCVGIRRYGDSAGNGSSLSDVTTAGVNLGHSMTYTGGVASSNTVIGCGILEVTSTSQKHGIYNYTEADSALGSGGFGASSTQIHIQAWICFQKIG